MKRPSIIDVAAIAGVSTATISRALNNPASVSDKTREKVFSAIEKTNYVQSANAQNFKQQRTNSILVIASDLGNSFYSEVFRGIQQRASALGYAISISNPQLGGMRELVRDNLLTGKFDGLIILSGYIFSDADHALMSEIFGDFPPIVVLSEMRNSTALPHILIDNEVAASLAIQHFLRLGHTKIGHITAPENTVVGTARMLGFKSALTQADLPLTPDHIIRGGFSVEHGRQAAHVFMALKSRPTAILCANDECAMGFIAKLHAHEIHVPADVSVMGFDDIVLSSAFIPALTTIHQPKDTIGEATMTMLVDIIERPNEITTCSREIPINFVERQSTRPL